MHWRALGQEPVVFELSYQKKASLDLSKGWKGVNNYRKTRGASILRPNLSPFIVSIFSYGILIDSPVHVSPHFSTIFSLFS